MTKAFTIRLMMSAASAAGTFSAYSAHAASGDSASPNATEVIELDKLVVSEKGTTGSDNAVAAAAALAQVPGSVHIVSGESLDRRRAFTTADVLAYQPAVFASASGGNDGVLTHLDALIVGEGFAQGSGDGP